MEKGNLNAAFRQEGYLYEVYDSKEKRVMFTNSLDAIDDENRIKNLVETGHKFKINGKSVAKTKILTEIKKIKAGQ